MSGETTFLVENTLEPIDTSPLRLDDVNWLVVLGVQNPQNLSQAWLDDINHLASLADLQLTWTAEEETRYKRSSCRVLSTSTDFSSRRPR